jgi:hypothetical protein
LEFKWQKSLVIPPALLALATLGDMGKNTIVSICVTMPKVAKVSGIKSYTHSPKYCKYGFCDFIATKG